MKKITILAVCALFFASSGCATKTNRPDSDDNVPAATSKTADDGQASAGTSRIKSIAPEVSGADILPAITKEYAGQVVLIDFWATWCGPCRMAMKEIDKIKPELQKKGCAFVYVTGETSPEAPWKQMIGSISGDHFRLTDKQWGELCTRLGIPGIPAYLLLNKDGSVAFSNLETAGYPGNEIIQNNVEVALTK